MHNSRIFLQRLIVFIIPLVALVAYGSLFLYPLEGKENGPATAHVTGDSIAPWPAGEQPLVEATRISAQAKGAKTDDDPAVDALLQKAREQGRVRVLVQLAVPFQPDGLLAPQASVQQQQAIADAQDSVLAALVDGEGARLIRRYTYTPLLALELDEAALRAARELSGISSIHEDELVPPALADSIPLINADQAWASGYTGEGWTVAVLDTGVDSSHPFLAGKVVSEACFSSNNPTYSASSVCPNGQETQIGPGSGANCAAGVTGCDHGTHVAGIAAGSNATFSGVARDATVIAIQVFTRIDSAAICNPLPSPCVLTATSDYIAGLDHVYGLRNTFDIAAANMSLGGGAFTSYCDTNPTKPSIDTLRSAGIATVVASGNNGFTNAISAPACISTAVSVGNTTKSDVVASSSNSASILNLLAPGTSIRSSIPGGNYAAFTGTSMAAPHVAGAWALYKEYDPGASVTEVLNNFVSTGISIADGRNGITKPRLELDFYGPSPTPTPTATPGPGSCSDIVVDGGYENVPPTGWFGSGSTYHYSTLSHSGNYSVIMGNAVSEESVLWQNYAIPANLTSATVSFWYQLTTAEAGSTPYDDLVVSVRNANGALSWATIAQLDNTDTTNGWTLYSYALTPSQLAAIAGQSGRLDFRLNNDFSLVTQVLVDDVTWQVCSGSGGGPTPTPTSTPLPSGTSYPMHLPAINK